MAFDLSGLEAYVDELSQDLTTKAILMGKTMESGVTVVHGLKGTTQLNQLDVEAVVKPATCGFTAGGGDVILTGRDITVKPLEVKEKLCPKTLEKYWVGQKMKPGTPTDFPFEKAVVDLFVKKIMKNNEFNFWQGDLAGVGTGGYENFDGFTSDFLIADGAIDGTAYAGPHTAANIIAHIDGMVSLVPEDILEEEDVTLNASHVVYKLYTQALRDLNLFHNDGDDNGFEMTIQGTNVKLKAQAGLSGVGTIANAVTKANEVMLLTNQSNLIIGTDMLHEEEKFDMWYSKDNDEVRTNVQFKYGTQVYYPSLCVVNYPDHL